jgi:hypothetical protein
MFDYIDDKTCSDCGCECDDMLKVIVCPSCESISVSFDEYLDLFVCNDCGEDFTTEG